MKDRPAPFELRHRVVLPTVVVIAILGVFGALFGPALCCDRSFVYRDAAHYYHPLFEFTASQWSAGRIPLWNPYSGIGQPLLADTTSSVLYPGKLVFALPWSYSTNYKLYVCGHVLLAAATAYLLARRWGASVTGAGCCGLSYAFSGNVVFQYCNVVFLVGAAWLPLALFAADRLLRTRRMVWAPVLGAILALMVFGGDPQAAYNAGLMAAGYAVLLWLRARALRRRISARPASPERWSPASPAGSRGPLSPPAAGGVAAVGWRRMISHRFVLLAAAAVSGAVLAAPQVLPAVPWVGRSHRAAFSVPRSLYEIPGYLMRRHVVPTRTGPMDGLLAKPEPGDHQEQIHYFSVGPWRLIEYLWPNISGRQFPIHRRWIETIPAEGMAWTPTFYMGVLPLLLALGSFRLRRASARRRWMSWIVLWAVLGSFGWYGLGWTAAEISHAAGGNPEALPCGPPWGGIYWVMTTLLPGYIHFRYPAKLLVMASLALSVLAARGWDRAFVGKSPGVRKSMLVLGAVSLGGMATVLALRPVWGLLFDEMNPNPLFGPFHAAGAWQDVLCAFFHTAVVCGLAYGLLPRHRPAGTRCGSTGECRRDVASWRNAFGFRCAARPTAALLLTALEISVAQSWLFPTAPQALWTDPGTLVAAIREDRENDRRAHWARVDRTWPTHWLRDEWKESGSADRQAAGLAGDKVTLMPLHNLPSRVGVLGTHGTIVSQDYAIFLDVSRSAGPPRQGRGVHLHPAVQDLLATDYTMIEGGRPPPPEASPLAEYREDEESRPWAALWRNERPHPRVWMAADVIRLDPLPYPDPRLIRARTREVLLCGKRFRDLHHTAMVETSLVSDEQIADVGGRSGRSSTIAGVSDACRIVKDLPQLVAIDVDLAKPGLLVLCDFYDPGWRAVVIASDGSAERRLPVLRTNRVMRGVFVPAGRHRIEFRYDPWSFRIGAVIGIVGWFGLVAGVVLMRYRGLAGACPINASSRVL